MIEFPYHGSGPYCYSSCLAMMMGADAPPIGIVETATGSAFGMQLVGGTLPFFDAFGWNPEIGVDSALAAFGWAADTFSGGDAGAALDRLAALLKHGPVMVGPVEMGYFSHQPGMAGPIGADHYAVVLEMAWGTADDHVVLHDPQGYPYARLPLADFTSAWSARTVDYGAPFTVRANFRRTAHVRAEEAVAAAIPGAVDRLSGNPAPAVPAPVPGDPAPGDPAPAPGAVDPDPAPPVPPGTLGNGDAALALADLLEAGGADGLRDHLVHFAVRVGARRLADAAACLRAAGRPEAAAVMTGQARLVGSLQHPLATGDFGTAATALRALAPTYDRLRDALRSR
ncbi:hypothetical protein LG943_04585 [Streptomonospora sp. S1-112]|uniref:Uncharacterized protein n=1 Tax=Streptomonospora mangrovi TaxID=2883123 RepID=A0A9X3SEC9_9ACTN|nr:hypothetical protein [Streptomonospora mangrovi]MDA0563610.1 hypothetical protein [Streptomonospora mangrovi]